MMKFMALLCLIATSCTAKPVANTAKPIKDSEMIQTGYKKSVNATNTLVLNYKILQEMGSPVKTYSYFVTEKATGEIMKKEEQIAAEKLYWKNTDTLAIVPYHDAMQQETIPGETQEKEILIKIKH